jgi:hypothetical protein
MRMFRFEIDKKENFNNYIFFIDSGGCQPCTTVQMQTDYAYQQQGMNLFFLLLFISII